MKRGAKVSWVAWVALILSAIVCLAGEAARRRLVRPLGAGDPELDSLLCAREQLRDNDDARLERLKARFAAEDHERWTSPRIAGFAQGFSRDWTIAPTADPSDRHVVTFTLVHHELHAWPTVLEAVRRIERTAGIAIESFDVRADGSAGGRKFAQVTIVVRLE